jgi:Putative zinc-finger
MYWLSREAGEGHVQVTIKCKDVWRELSSYLEDDLPEQLRTTMREHFRKCRHCNAVLNGVRNTIHLLGDDRSFDVPVRFSERLFRRISDRLRQEDNCRTPR